MVRRLELFYRAPIFVRRYWRLCWRPLRDMRGSHAWHLGSRISQHFNDTTSSDVRDV